MAGFIITDQYPKSDASGVYINDVVWAQFSEPIDPVSATYYNFSVNERDTYMPVDGTIELSGVSGVQDYAVAVFIPTNGLLRNTRYSVLASSSLKSKNGVALDHDVQWYFTTGNVAASGNIGDTEYDLDPSGFTSSGVAETGPTASGSTAEALIVTSTNPENYDSEVPTNVPHIAITFSDVIPSGINLYDHIRMTRKEILG